MNDIHIEYIWYDLDSRQLSGVPWGKGKGGHFWKYSFHYFVIQLPLSDSLTDNTNGSEDTEVYTTCCQVEKMLNA